MAQRIGLDIKNNTEIDLIWIPYIMISFPLPYNSLKHNFSGYLIRLI